MKRLLLILTVFSAMHFTFAQQESAFKEGEWFKFKMSYSGFLKAGNATLLVKDEKLGDKDVYHVVGKGWTTGMIKWFFKVKDRYETYFDKETIVPYKFVRNIDEGGYTKDLEIEFDQQNNKAYINDKKHKTKKVIDTKPNIQDMVSTFYYLRNNLDISALEIGDEVKVDMFFDEENYGFKLQYLGEEIIKTEVGKIRALKFRPYVMAGRVFKEEESLTLWVSNDKNKIPLRIKADLAVGSLRADLEAFKGLKYPFQIVVKRLMDSDSDITNKLQEKYESIDQDLDVHLEGLLHSKPISYWDYIQTDVLLNLQKPRTDFPDEMVFIMYHQISELLFKMILSEIEQVAENNFEVSVFTEKVMRVSRYFDVLTSSFSIMKDGMNIEQYNQFRTTLTPASGFQSAQYRLVEFGSTELINLIDKRFRDTVSKDICCERAFEQLYWQAAGKDYETGKKTYTLSAFEERYKDEFIRFSKKYESKNLWSKYKELPEDSRANKALIRAMRHYDYTVNVKWVMAHYTTANHYLNIGGETAEATGGSEWVKYMHPKYQKRIFFPDLWTAKRKRELGRKYLIILVLGFLFIGCKNDTETEVEATDVAIVETPKPVMEFGFALDNYVVKRDTVRNGDTFGIILERNHVGYPKIFNIAQKAKDTFDIARGLQVGKPYTMLCAKDSLETAQCFIYQPNLEDYVVINFQDSIHAYKSTKPIKYVEKVATGVIKDNISVTLDEQGLSPRLAYMMADEIYAWTIDFNRLLPNDRFKVIYVDKYIDDTIYTGVHKVKAAYFEHNSEPFYAFEFMTDTTKGIVDYFDDNAKNLRRAFLKSPIKFGRLSSRYNLKRRIAYYGYKIRPHKGTDFAAAVGTPIMATANGTVTESTRRGGNGKYVKIRHNATYETQYLHMSKRLVKVGQFVKQGDIIGKVGMTGNTGGPHVCYRFWKNGKQVDPFKQKLPEAKPISDSLKDQYLEFIKPNKYKLDNINFKPQITEEEQEPVIYQSNS